jgi:hypothetical protein
MNRFSYHVYYEHRPSKGDPLRSPKSEKQIADALSAYHRELAYNLDDEAKVTSLAVADKPHSRHLAIVTALDEAATTEAVKKCLGAHGLWGEIMGDAQF